MLLPEDPNQSPADALGASVPGMDPMGGAMDAMAGMDAEPALLSADEALEEELEPVTALLPEQPGAAADYQVKLDEDALEQLGRRVRQECEQYWNATQARRENAKEWRRDAKLTESDQPTPWEGASALRNPGVALACQNHTTRLNGAIGGHDPAFGCRPRSPEAEAHAPELEEGIAAALEEAQWLRVMRLTHKELPIVAPCAVRVEWLTKTRKRPTTEVDVNHELLKELLEAEVDPVEAQALATVRDPKTNKAKLTLGWTTVTLFDGNHLRCVPFERLVLLPLTVTEQDDLWALGERLAVRGLDLQEGADSGAYLKSGVERILSRSGDPVTEDQQERGSLQGMELDGESAPASGTGDARRDALYASYDCVELDWLDDLDNDGEQEWYLVGVHLPTATVYRAQYSPYWHGRSRYVLFPYLESADELLGESVAERLSVLQDGATALINQFVDMIDKLVASGGNFFYDGTASKLHPGQWELDPALPIKVDQVSGIMPNPIAPGVAQALPHLLQALGQFKEWFDLVSASSNPALGRETAGDKTLGEVQAVLGQASQIFEDYSQGPALNWARVVDLVRWNLAQYSESGQFRFRRAAGGQTAFKKLSADVLTADVDFVPVGLTNLPDAQARLQRDLLVMDLLQKHPVASQDPVALTDALAQTLQDVRWPNHEALVQRLQQSVQQMQQAQAQAAALEAAAAAAERERAAGDAARADRQQDLTEAQALVNDERAGSAETRAQEAHALQQAAQMEQLLAGAGANGAGPGADPNAEPLL